MSTQAPSRKPPAAFTAKPANVELKYRKVDPGQPMFPLNAPGMPLPGPLPYEHARALGDTTEIVGKAKSRQLAQVGEMLTNLYHQILYSPTSYVPAKTKAGEIRMMRCVPGHLWGGDVTGPVRATVMVIGKMLGEDERNSGRNFAGPTGRLLLDSCNKLGIHPAQWYVTNLMKTEHPNAANGDTDVRKAMIDEWLPLLHQELRLVCPDYILCLGTDASKALLGKDATVSKMDGRVVEYRIPLRKSQDDEDETHVAQVMTIVHPAWVLREPNDLDKFENGLNRFGQLIGGTRWDQKEDGLDHRVIDNLKDLKKLYFEIQRDCKDGLLGVDLEWHGEHPVNKGAYVRTFQVSWAHKKAACISLRHPGGKLRFQGGILNAHRWIQKICRDKILVGHFFAADMEWAQAAGLKEVLKTFFSVPRTWQAYMRRCLAGKGPAGFDTGYAAHAVCETDSFDLTSLTLKYTAAPRYDLKLEAWKTQYCKDHKMKVGDMEGYGECPNDVLEPYGCYDADVTRRIAVKLLKLLCSDGFGNNCWEPFWINMRAVPAILEINTTGLPVDRKRMELLTETYRSACASMERQIREWAKWSDFNLNSVFDVREYLFGEKYNGKKRVNPTDPPIRLRPAKAKSLRLMPVLTTDKRSMQWAEVIERGLEAEKTPSTGKLALAILMQESMEVVRKKHGQQYIEDCSKQVGWIRDHRFIRQVLKYTLRPPNMKDGLEEFERDEDGELVYDKGLPASICDDGYVRTHISPTKETGRWGSSRPSMQNFTKRREKDYKRILGPDYKYPLRTIITAPPGCVIIEADYIGAELAGMAFMSGDPTMIDHVMRAQLPESDPRYYDIHSHIACLAFQLQCVPTKHGLDKIGKKHLRDVAKTVVFGIAYGRGAKAIALAAREESIFISVAEAQAVIDAVFEMYPGLVPYFAACRERALTARWLCGAYGRFRRFPVTQDRKVAGDFEREAQNFPIQGFVADMVGRAVDHVYHYREKHPDLWYRLALQIHDSLMVVTKGSLVPQTIQMLRTCMRDRVPLYPCHLDGTPDGTGPHYLDVDINIFTHWMQQMMPDECLSLGFSPKYAGWLKVERGWLHPSFDKKIWRKGQLYDIAV
jgi:uracil-DNA glycosylase family 4